MLSFQITFRIWLNYRSDVWDRISRMTELSVLDLYNNKCGTLNQYELEQIGLL